MKSISPVISPVAVSRMILNGACPAPSGLGVTRTLASLNSMVTFPPGLCAPALVTCTCSTTTRSALACSEASRRKTAENFFMGLIEEKNGLSPNRVHPAAKTSVMEAQMTCLETSPVLQERGRHLPVSVGNLKFSIIHGCFPGRHDHSDL